MCYWPSMWSRWLDFGQVLFCIFIDQDKLEVNKNTHKKTRPIYSHLDRASLLNKGLITWPKRELLFAEPMQEILNWQDEPLTCSGSQSKCTICFILSACWFSHACIIRMHILGEPISTYKFSRPISIHFRKELVERIWEKIKDFSLRDHFINSPRLCSWHCMDIIRRKLMLDLKG